MKLCFHFQQFDIDISSGTLHARHMWHELASGYGINEMAVINETGEKFESVTEDMTVKEYPTLNRFIKAELTSKQVKMVFLESPNRNLGPGASQRDIRIAKRNAKKFKHCKGYKMTAVDWLVIGGTGGLPTNRRDVDYVNLSAASSLYPREAAAVVLELSTWG